MLRGGDTVPWTLSPFSFTLVNDGFCLQRQEDHGYFDTYCRVSAAHTFPQPLDHTIF